jgi:branched-chain amino acid transport system substrate-binding protein
MSRSRTTFILFLLITLLCSSSGATVFAEPSSETRFPNDTTQTDQPLPVGVLVMQSGFVSSIGDEYIRAWEMVRQEFPDTPVEMIVRDAGSNASVAGAAWQSMKQQNPEIAGVVTVASWTSNVVYPEAAQTGLIQLALGSAIVHRNLTSDRLIRFTPGGEQEAPVLAAYLNTYDRIAVLGGDNDYTNGYYADLQALLPERIVLMGYYDPTDPASSLNVADIRESDPDVIVLLSVSEAATVIDLLRSQGITVPLVGTRVIESENLMQSSAAEGLVFSTPALNRSHPFFSRYYDQYGVNATFFGAEGYDAMKILYTVADSCETSPECLYEGFANKTYEGALGTIRFDDTAVASYPIELRVVRNNTHELFEVPDTGDSTP